MQLSVIVILCMHRHHMTVAYIAYTNITLLVYSYTITHHAGLGPNMYL